MIGQEIKRREDALLLTGRGRFTDDHSVPGQVFCAFVRSQIAHGMIRGIDRSQALELPGVIGVFTAKDLSDDQVSTIGGGIGARALEYPNRDGTTMVDLGIPVLASQRVRYAGELVAGVIAESAAAARDGVEALVADYEELGAVVDCADALLPGAPELWPEVPGNQVFDYGAGDEAATSEAFETAAHVVRETFVNNRVFACFTEPRGALATYDDAAGAFTLVTGCQSVHGLARGAARTLGVGANDVRVISPDAGGGFGARSVLYPEYVFLLWAARRVGRPVKWTGGRDEEFLATTHGRDAILTGSLGLDQDGRFVAYRVEGIANFGARHAGVGPFSTLRNLARMLPGVYDIPAVYLNLRGAFTNTAPVSSYRGVGRVEANYVIERLIDKAARVTGVDRVKLRRANVIAESALPKMTGVGSLYDSGDYAGNMDMVMDAGCWDSFFQRRDEARLRGKLRGIAICNYIEGAGGGAGEYGRVAIDRDGRVSIAAGAVDQGQGQRTIFCQIAAHVLGVDVADVEMVASDTALIRDGVGTNASRSTVRAGKAINDAAFAIIEAGRPAAARLLQAKDDEVMFKGGVYRARGKGEVGLQAVARTTTGLASEIRHDDETVTFPNGTHLVEVEVDPETGVVEIVQFVAVDDVGRAVNPMLVRGQSQGGIAQGVGQALMEHIRYDRESGQLATGSLMDYAVPRASDLPKIVVLSNDRPCPFTPHGLKGAGEGGTTGAPASVINAILDALSPLGVQHIDMPATAETVWRAIQAARGQQG